MAAELAARLGYFARGAVYVSVGIVALLAAVGLSPHATGALGALDAWGEWPAGIVLLWLVGLGLYAFAGWRALQAVFDADSRGREPKALAIRAGQAISGLVYGGLAVSTFGLLDTLEDLHEADDQAKTRAFVAQALEIPGGDWAVIGVGLFILACAVGNMVRAVFGHFARPLSLGDRHAAWSGTLARLGYFGRGLALAPAGVFIVRAGLHARAVEARGVGGALEAVKAQPYGHFVLALMALGLVAFGLFGFVEAWRRPIRTGDAMEDA
jgi:hypothetical protein